MTKNNNTGYRNTGLYNNGNCNSGDCNSGSRNTGNGNSGDSNTGSWNSGFRNTGFRNTGYKNTGIHNSGILNTGSYNTGSWNTGNWNSGNYNNGYCNSATPDECLIFNKPGSHEEWEDADKPDWMFAKLTEWVLACEMTDEEKKENPSYKTADGYLKSYSSLQEAFKEAWDEASQEDREKTKQLPNFDPDVFAEVFGFNPFLNDPDCYSLNLEEDAQIMTFNGETYKVVKIS